MFFMAGMIVPGASYWNLASGLLPGEAVEDQEAVDNMRHLGRVIDWLGQALARRQYPD
jgi:hypothetical protein